MIAHSKRADCTFTRTDTEAFRQSAKHRTDFSRNSRIIHSASDATTKGLAGSPFCRLVPFCVAITGRSGLLYLQGAKLHKSAVWRSSPKSRFGAVAVERTESALLLAVIMFLECAHRFVLQESSSCFFWHFGYNSSADGREVNPLDKSEQSTGFR